MRTDEPDVPRGARPPGTLRIGSIAGIDVLLTTSWFLVAALISVAIAPRVEQVEPGLGVWKYVAGVVFAIVLGVVVLGEPFSWQLALGAALIVAGALVIAAAR